jgi:hypothetical protein
MVEVRRRSHSTWRCAWSATAIRLPTFGLAELVTQLDWVPDRDPREIGRELSRRNI